MSTVLVLAACQTHLAEPSTSDDSHAGAMLSTESPCQYTRLTHGVVSMHARQANSRLTYASIARAPMMAFTQRRVGRQSYVSTCIA